MLSQAYGRDRSLGQVIGKLWQIATREGLGGLKQRIGRSGFNPDPNAPPPPPPPDFAKLYTAWLQQFDVAGEANMRAARQHLATLSLPDVLILAVATPGSLPAFQRIVASWQESIHGGWQAGIVPAAGLDPAALQTLRTLASADPRITLLTTPAEIEAARNRCEYTLLCYGPPLLNSLTLYMFTEAAVRTGAAVLYSDHDRIGRDGARTDPAFKPQFSPEYAAHYNYIGDCLMLARRARFTPDQAAALLEGSLPGYDRLVAALVQGQSVEHLPFTLFHVLGQPPRVAHDRPEIQAGSTGVAIIIPTKDGLSHLQPCIASILERTSYDLDLVDLIVIDNNSSEAETLDYLDALAQQPRATVLKYPHPFNFAEINNLGARATERPVLVFLNNDTLVHDPDWLSKLVWHAQQPGVGIVGAKLLFPDGTIQHGGCAAGASMGTVAHLLTNADPDRVAGIDHTREMATLTGACMAVRRTVFQQVGGFDPVLRVTWNDVKLCLACLEAGFRNIYIADPLLIHDETKTRGHDNTRERMDRYFGEANYTRRQFRDYFYDDPSFNPNRSVDKPGFFAEPPRLRLPWSRTGGQTPRILVLSAVYKVGFGVPLVIQQQVLKLKQLGFDMIIGGPEGKNEFDFPGCTRVVLGSSKEAASYAFTADVALIIAHTPPYFEIPIFIGAHIPVLAYDYGEPSAEFFPDPVRSYLQNVEYQKRSAAALTTCIATISQAVKDETLNKDAIVAGLANSHLPSWSEARRPQRDELRRQMGWEDRFVVFTVCRFGENERVYKGLDKVTAILGAFPYQYPSRAKDLVWVLAGAGSEEDVAEAERLGFTVFPNVSDAMLTGLYTAADAYMGFSRWEGYNLGISQALAMGLPTLGSDIPAHREFPIVTTGSILAACRWLDEAVEAGVAAGPGRLAIVYDWEASTDRFNRIVVELLQRPDPPRPRFVAGAPAPGVVQDCAA